jgi:hypothetical protein
MPTKLEVIAQHESMVQECETILAKPTLPEQARKNVTSNLQKSKDWIEFLKLPDTPELLLPIFTPFVGVQSKG